MPTGKAVLETGRDNRSIVFIWDNFGPTLIDRAEAVAAALAPQAVVGVELHRESTDYDWRSEPGTRFRKVNLPREDGAWPLRAWRLMRTVLKQRPAFVFSCHYERTEVFCVAAALRLLGVPVYTMFDSKFDDYSRVIWREVLKQILFLPYCGALVGSHRSADYLRFLGLRPDRLMLGYDAISIDRIRSLAGAAPAPGGVSFRDRHFSIVARLMPKKNLSLALQAFARLRQEGCQRELVICGSGPLEQGLREQAVLLGVANAVRFEGFLQAEAVAQVLGSSLALIQPSIEEQFGITIAEAVSMGVPVLVSENCGARDTLVRTGVNGFVFEPDNVDGLANLMRRIDADPALWRQLSEGCARFAPLADTPIFVDSVRRLCGLPPPLAPTGLAPIAIFAHRRAKHLERCLDALQQCPEFRDSRVFVYVDGPRDEADFGAVAAVRTLLDDRCCPNMTVVSRDTNRGLAASIIEEVTTLVNAHGRVIVIEDDLVVEPATLRWLNQALDTYEDNPKVMQISANQFRVYEFDDNTAGSFQRFTTTWGWATWKRAWDFFDPLADGWHTVSAPGPARDAFDAGGVYPFSDMLVKQMSGELDSWGIRWSWSMYKAGGLTLMPPRSLVRNEGRFAGATHNSIGWLKLLVSGPRPRRWRKLEPPCFPVAAEVVPSEEAAFRRGLRRTRAMRNARIKALLSIFNVRVSSVRIHRRIRRIIAVAQLPPPVSGLSAVSERMVSALQNASLLFNARNVAPAPGLSGAVKAVDRIIRTLRTGTNLLRPLYRRSTTLYLPCDGGFGQIYNLMIIMFARLGHYEIWLHHHSFAYIDRRSTLTTLLLSMSPIGTNHIFLCQKMVEQFQATYGKEWQAGRHSAHIISNAFTVEQPLQRERASGPLTIGHLSNLTADKGSVRFIDLFKRLSASGMSIRGELAGPIHDKVTAEAVRSAEIAYPSTFKWHGPLSGEAKEAFYDKIDVFVFPTRYVNEAQPLVLLEALAHGAAVVTCRRGCIACDHSTAPGLVVDEADFDEAAFAWLSGLTEDARRNLPRESRDAFAAARRESEKQISAVFAAMKNEPCGHGRTTGLPSEPSVLSDSPKQAREPNP